MENETEAIKAYKETQGDFSLKIWSKSTNAERNEQIKKVKDFINPPTLEGKQEVIDDFIPIQEDKENTIENSLFISIVTVLIFGKKIEVL